MSTNPFEVFRTRDDYLNWNRYDQQLDAIDLSGPIYNALGIHLLT
jgi:hypothetical protein